MIDDSTPMAPASLSSLPGNVVLQDPHWIDLHAPTLEEMQTLASHFGFHPLSVEDALDPRAQRPKLDRYDAYRYIIFYEFDVPTETGPGKPHEFHVFWGRDYVVTVHEGDVGVVEEAKRRWRLQEYDGAYDCTALVHTILDVAVDSALPVIDAMTERVEELEDMVFERQHENLAQRGQVIRRDLVALRRILMPERDIVVGIGRDPWIGANTELVRYFDDIYDHVTRAAESVDTEREIVTGVLESYLSAVSNSLNEVMKTLTVAATILMTMSVIVGIYGMNFVHMPELGWKLGYPLALGLMGASAAALLAYFRRQRWL